MKNSINLNIIRLTIVFSIFCTTTTYTQNQQISKEIALIAERDFKLFLERIPIGMEANYGFSDRNEFEKASLGKPISILFPSEYFYNHAPVDSSKTNFEDSSIYEVPILVNGNISCLLRLISEYNNISAIGIGGSLTAIEIDKITKGIGGGIENEISLINFPELKSQYLIVHDNSITYKNSKCYRIGNIAKPESMEISLLNVMVSSKQSLKERKGINYEQ